MRINAYAAPKAGAPLGLTTIERRAVGVNDVLISIEYAGICHSDIHIINGDWGPQPFPVVPGHEIVGTVTEVGAEVTNHKVGDRVGVGCMVNACRECASCLRGDEQYCLEGSVGTYAVTDRDGTTTQGGYSTAVVVDANFVLSIPDGIDPAAAAPLLCAGITTYTPLKHWNAGPGTKVAVVGLGGLGHMGVKLAHAMGAHVVLFTTSAGKAADAKKLGADEVVLSKDEAAMKPHAGSFHFILDTVAAPHNLDAYTALLGRDGTLCLVGAPELPHPSPAVFNLIFGRKSIAGSLIGGIAETQEMLDFCAEHGIVADIEMIRADDIESAYERMLRSDVKYRFVIDTASMG